MGSQFSKAFNEDPPPYSPNSPSQCAACGNIQISPPSIKATDIPQWRWTNAQCIEWLTAVFTVYAGYDQKTAEAKAKEFRGFGPRLWQMGRGDWYVWLGVEVGGCVYIILMEMYPEKGTHPKGITLSQFEPR